MVTQIRGRQAHDVHHESPHDILIFKVKKSLPKMVFKTLALPKTDEQCEQFASHFENFTLNNSELSKIDMFYSGVE